jgi:hypothetical protein
MARMYVIKDVVADVIQAGPWMSINDAAMVRQVIQLLDSTNPAAEQYRANPADYELWYVADMDDKTGFITPAEEPIMMHRFSSLYSKKESPTV